MKNNIFSKVVKIGFISGLVAVIPITHAQADPRVCHALAKIAHGSVVARDEGTPIQVLEGYVREGLSESPFYETAMLVMEKSYYGFPDATPEEAYVETLLQCQG